MLVLIDSIKEVPANFGQVHNFKPAKYARTHTRTSVTSLLINGTDQATGERIYFFTTGAEIASTTGMLHYKTLRTNPGGWWEKVEGEMVEHKSPFQGDTIMPVVIESKDVVQPRVKAGDLVEMEGKIKDTAANGAKRYTHTKLVNIIK